jgi:hypothetical protein
MVFDLKNLNSNVEHKLTSLLLTTIELSLFSFDGQVLFSSVTPVIKQLPIMQTIILTFYDFSFS